ncbi:MAG: class I SAM-dependent methyltransferase [Elusimicrobiales bacterium]|jgi:SAM-dependent methyltransferase
MRVKNDWHKDFFRNSFYNPASPAAVAKAPMEVDFILKQLRLRKGARLLDLCCGPARHSILLAKKGLAVTGYDYSADYLKEASAKAKKAGVKLTLVRGDMRRLDFNGGFDAVINLFTSFGYFQRFSEDLKTLKGAARALKPGGFFLIDLIHGDFLRKNFRARTWGKAEDGSYTLEETELSGDGIHSAWTVIKKGRVSEKSFFTRLYSKNRLSSALRQAGLKPVKFWGGFHGEKLTDGTDRLIALAVKQKPARKS